MRSFALLAVFIFLFSGFGPKPRLEEVCLSPEENKLYDLIMEYRKSKKLESIPLSAKLTLVAQLHAKDLSEHFDITRRNECNPHSWSTNGNWTPCCYTNDHKAGDCMWTKPQEIAGYSGSGFEMVYYNSLGTTAKESLDGWKISSGHNPLLINTGTWSKVKWNAVGIGIYKEYGVVWFGEIVDHDTINPCD
jgi:uncharacterized protein YkwD